MIFKPIRMVTFDVTDTLLRFRVSPGQQYALAAAKHGIALDGEAMAPIFKKNYKHLCSKYPNFGKANSMHWDDWWRNVVRSTLNSHVSDANTLDKIASYLIESYKSKESWTVNEGSMDILNFLKEKGVIIGVISNFDPRLNDILVNVELREYFDFVLTSYEAGFAKPDMEIFMKALAHGGLAGEEPTCALHVGDDARLDYAGARAAGWQAALLSPNPRSTAWPGDEWDPLFTQDEDTYEDLVDLYKYFSWNNDLFEK